MWVCLVLWCFWVILLLILWLIFDFDCGSVYQRKKQMMMMRVLVVQMEKREKKTSKIRNYYNNV